MLHSENDHYPIVTIIIKQQVFENRLNPRVKPHKMRMSTRVVFAFVPLVDVCGIYFEISDFFSSVLELQSEVFSRPRLAKPSFRNEKKKKKGFKIIFKVSQSF